MYSSFQALKEGIELCKKCPLCEKRQHVVLGQGNETAEVMFVGEGPGAEEDKQGEPFVGPAGMLFDKYLKHIDLNRDKIYITNIVKCRPPMNRDPKEEEQDACIPYLWQQMEFIKPKIVVCLGRIAAQKFVNPDFRVTKDHGKFSDKHPNFLFMGTFHPAALLRNPEFKGPALEDFLALQQKIYEVCERTY